MSPGLTGNGGFAVQPNSLTYTARLMENIAAEFERLAAALGRAFESARSGAGEPDLERCLGLAALDFDEYTRSVATAAHEEAHKLRDASLEYVATDESAADGFDHTAGAGIGATGEALPLTTRGPQ